MKTSKTRRRSIWIGGLLTLVMVSWGIASLDLPLTGPDLMQNQTPEAPTDPLLPADSESEDVEDAQTSGFRPDQIVGHWLLEDSIRREIVIRPDGTATMDVTLDYFSALLYAREMKMELTWKLENDILTHSIISGTPKKTVERLVRDFGGTRSYRVVRATKHDLVLESPSKDKTIHDWVAVE